MGKKNELKEYFYNRTEFKEKSKCSTKRRRNKEFTPKPGKSILLDTYIEEVKGDVVNGLKQRKLINLTKKDENALKDILKDDNIQNLKAIQKSTNRTNRRIGTATERIAEIEEKELDNYVINSPSYIRDTTNVLVKLSKVKQPIPRSSILFCFDVVKLYPSIPREKGLKACKKALDTRKDKEMPTKDILEMIKLVLEGNNFKFMDRDFVQNEGVAIGSKLGKICLYSYATMGQRAGKIQRKTIILQAVH
ncbi:unnamed protein product [Mytilus coruscus]|uniref:Reverse transcriptase domain-containing protein n=1 Tax=Mytilus coruscus TaxID=42192 RepID=A0A6J8DV47_MYTCO|nr:unnamed protein product [Mytilus coruscus]